MPTDFPAQKSSSGKATASVHSSPTGPLAGTEKSSAATPRGHEIGFLPTLDLEDCKMFDRHMQMLYGTGGSHYFRKQRSDTEVLNKKRQENKEKEKLGTSHLSSITEDETPSPSQQTVRTDAENICSAGQPQKEEGEEASAENDETTTENPPSAPQDFSLDLDSATDTRNSTYYDKDHPHDGNREFYSESVSPPSTPLEKPAETIFLTDNEDDSALSEHQQQRAEHSSFTWDADSSGLDSLNSKIFSREGVNLKEEKSRGEMETDETLVSHLQSFSDPKEGEMSPTQETPRANAASILGQETIASDETSPSASAVRTSESSAATQADHPTSSEQHAGDLEEAPPPPPSAENSSEQTVDPNYTEIVAQPTVQTEKVTNGERVRNVKNYQKGTIGSATEGLKRFLNNTSGSFIEKEQRVNLLITMVNQYVKAQNGGFQLKATVKKPSWWKKILQKLRKEKPTDVGIKLSVTKKDEKFNSELLVAVYEGFSCEHIPPFHFKRQGHIFTITESHKGFDGAFIFNNGQRWITEKRIAVRCTIKEAEALPGIKHRLDYLKNKRSFLSRLFSKRERTLHSKKEELPQDACLTIINQDPSLKKPDWAEILAIKTFPSKDYRQLHITIIWTTKRMHEFIQGRGKGDDLLLDGF